MLKKLVFAVVMITLMLSFCSVFADQDGRNCWCNIDKDGCWITGDDGGKIYIMFWSEESRQYIMGTHSAPYELVTVKPESLKILLLKCGTAVPVIYSGASNTDQTDPKEPDTGSPQCDRSNAYYSCIEDCNLKDGLTSCFDQCDENYPGCISY